MADSDGADYSRELEHATLAAREAGAVALEHYGKVERLTKTHAATTDEPVTIADRAAQRAVLDRLRRVFPDYGVIGEESETGESITAENLRPDGRNWVIDPIDGTNNFIAGLGNWAVCVGLLDAGRPVVGVVYDVTRDLMYGGVVGGGATVNGREAVVKDEPMSPTSVFMLTSNLVNTGPAPGVGEPAVRPDRLEGPHARHGGVGVRDGRRGDRGRGDHGQRQAVGRRRRRRVHARRRRPRHEARRARRCSPTTSPATTGPRSRSSPPAPPPTPASSATCRRRLETTLAPM